MSSDGRREHRAKIQKMLAGRDQAQKVKDDLAAADRVKKAAAAKAAAMEAKKREATTKALAEKMAHAARPRKVLVCGDAKGSLDKLVTTVQAQAAKVGAFDALFCVGSFVSELDAIDEAMASYLRGEKTVPLEVYFIDTGPALLHASPRGRQLCENLHFLGGYGVRELCGLKVAFLSGVYDPTRYDNSDADFVGNAFTARAVAKLQQLATEGQRQPGIDLLLTCGWPAELDLKIDEEALRPARLDDGLHWQRASAPPLADLCSALEPRYHIFGTADLFYQRPPFTVSRQEHVCRCIGLGSVGSTSKQRKWLHALSLSPMKHMKRDDLKLLPGDATPSPFVGRPKRATPISENEPAAKRKSPEDDKELPELAFAALLAGNSPKYRALVEKLQDARLDHGSAAPERRAVPTAQPRPRDAGSPAAEATGDSASDQPGPRKMPRGTAHDFKQREDQDQEQLTEEDLGRQEEAKVYLAKLPEKGVVRYTFLDEGTLGLRLSRDVPPWILEVRDGTLSAKKAPRVPVGGVVLAVNGYELKAKEDKLVAKALQKRPVILDVQWPLDQGQPTVCRA